MGDGRDGVSEIATGREVVEESGDAFKGEQHAGVFAVYQQGKRAAGRPTGAAPSGDGADVGARVAAGDYAKGGGRGSDGAGGVGDGDGVSSGV